MRELTTYASPAAQLLLDRLTIQNTSSDSYREAMTFLGHELSNIIGSQLAELGEKPICIACTVEDADFLATGIIEGLLFHGISADKIRLACFWNERVDPFQMEELSIAPILKKYIEPIDLNESLLVVVKSIISGACVVKTNLSTLIEDSNPIRVIVAAPVMYKGAEERLGREFGDTVASRFEYVTFAVDDERQGKEVVPGIGGSVYERLGFQGQADKNSYLPEIVKRRRERFFGAPQSA